MKKIHKKVLDSFVALYCICMLWILSFVTTSEPDYTNIIDIFFYKKNNFNLIL